MVQHVGKERDKKKWLDKKNGQHWLNKKRRKLRNTNKSKQVDCNER